MKRAIETTEKRRALQDTFNKEHNITPKTIIKPISNTLEITKKVTERKLKISNSPLRSPLIISTRSIVSISEISQKAF